MPTPRIRQAARAVLTSPDEQLLLVHLDLSWDPGLPRGLWICPGGGIEPGEEPVDALRRELLEEVGVAFGDLGDPVWTAESRWPVSPPGSPWHGQRDLYFWKEVDSAFDPRPHFTAEEMLAEHVDEMAWWTRSDLERAGALWEAGRADDPGGAVFAPRRLSRLVGDLLAHGRPARPISIQGFE